MLRNGRENAKRSQGVVTVNDRMSRGQVETRRAPNKVAEREVTRSRYPAVTTSRDNASARERNSRRDKERYSADKGNGNAKTMRLGDKIRDRSWQGSQQGNAREGQRRVQDKRSDNQRSERVNHSQLREGARTYKIAFRGNIQWRHGELYTKQLSELRSEEVNSRLVADSKTEKADAKTSVASTDRSESFVNKVQSSTGDSRRQVAWLKYPVFGTTDKVESAEFEENKVVNGISEDQPTFIGTGTADLVFDGSLISWLKAKFDQMHSESEKDFEEANAQMQKDFEEANVQIQKLGEIFLEKYRKQEESVDLQQSEESADLQQSEESGNLQQSEDITWVIRNINGKEENKTTNVVVNSSYVKEVVPTLEDKPESEIFQKGHAEEGNKLSVSENDKLKKIQKMDDKIKLKEIFCEMPEENILKKWETTQLATESEKVKKKVHSEVVSEECENSELSKEISSTKGRNVIIIGKKKSEKDSGKNSELKMNEESDVQRGEVERKMLQIASAGNKCENKKLRKAASKLGRDVAAISFEKTVVRKVNQCGNIGGDKRAMNLGKTVMAFCFQRATGNVCGYKQSTGRSTRPARNRRCSTRRRVCIAVRGTGRLLRVHAVKGAGAAAWRTAPSRRHLSRRIRRFFRGGRCYDVGARPTFEAPALPLRQHAAQLGRCGQAAAACSAAESPRGYGRASTRRLATALLASSNEVALGAASAGTARLINGGRRPDSDSPREFPKEFTLSCRGSPLRRHGLQTEHAREGEIAARTRSPQNEASAEAPLGRYAGSRLRTRPGTGADGAEGRAVRAHRRRKRHRQLAAASGRGRESAQGQRAAIVNQKPVIKRILKLTSFHVILNITFGDEDKQASEGIRRHNIWRRG